jgi:hypothetical protein
MATVDPATVPVPTICTSPPDSITRMTRRLHAEPGGRLV